MGQLIDKVYSFVQFLADRYLYQIFTIVSIIYLLLNWTFTINYPWNYDDVYMCLLRYDQYLAGEMSLFAYFTDLNNGHPIIFQRIYTWWCHLLFGVVNYKIILLMSSMGIVGWSWMIVRRIEDKVHALLVMALLLTFTNSIFLWTSASAVYAYTMLMLWLCCVLIERDDSIGVILLFPVSFLLFFSFGNSLLAFPILIYFILRRSGASGTIKVWSILPIAVSFAYYLHTITNARMFNSAHAPDDGGTLWEKGWFAFSFVGSLCKHLSLSMTHHIVLGGLAGLVISSYALYWLLQFRFSKWLAILILIIGSGCIVALRRYDGADMYLALDNRYEWYGVFAVIAVVGVLFEYQSDIIKRIPGKTIVLFLFVIVGLKCGWNMYKLPDYHQFSVDRACQFINGNTPEAKGDPLHLVQEVVDESVKSGLFRPQQFDCQ